MTFPKDNLKTVHIIGGLLVLTGTALKFFQFNFANYIFAAGAGVLLILQFVYLRLSANADEKTKRINRLMLLVTGVLGLGAYFMFTGKSNWVATVLVYALASLFLAFRSKTES